MLVFRSACSIANIGFSNPNSNTWSCRQCGDSSRVCVCPQEREICEIVGLVTIENIHQPRLFHRRYNRAPSFVVNPELFGRWRLLMDFMKLLVQDLG